MSLYSHRLTTSSVNDGCLQIICDFLTGQTIKVTDIQEVFLLNSFFSSARIRQTCRTDNDCSDGRFCSRTPLYMWPLFRDCFTPSLVGDDSDVCDVNRQCTITDHNSHCNRTSHHCQCNERFRFSSMIQRCLIIEKEKGDSPISPPISASEYGHDHNWIIYLYAICLFTGLMACSSFITAFRKIRFGSRPRSGAGGVVVSLGPNCDPRHRFRCYSACCSDGVTQCPKENKNVLITQTH